MENGDHSQTFSLAKDRFPFIFHRGKITTTSLELFGLPKDRSGSASPKLNLTLSAPGGTALELLAGSAIGLATHIIAKADVEVKHTVQNRKDADWTILVGKTDVSGSLDLLEDILVLCHYSVLLKKNS